MKQKEEKKEITRSYVTGVVALVFMIIGYQTALFIHSAAVTKIASDMDIRDTVYVAVGESGSNPSSLPAYPSAVQDHKPVPSGEKATVCSERVRAVRQNYPIRKTESFRFNPNTISVDDLCRLGFSMKQAAAIDNYRKKGGRFRRKSDFAKSFVVSDSIFRRLEPFIDIPLVDLNLADSADFDALPGIGGWFASRMIEHRKALGGYSYKEQLMDIYRFDRNKFDALSDLVEVSEENITPYPIWTLPSDSLRLHPYIGDYAAEGVVLYRENNPVGKCTVGHLVKAGVIDPETAPKLLRCVVAPAGQ